MRGVEFQARDRKVHKMTRDGLVEKNLTKGTEQRASSREADVSFGRAGTERQKTEPKSADTHGTRHTGIRKPGANGRISAGQEQGEAFSGASAPEVWGPAGTPASMRDAGDRPAAGNRAGGHEKSRGAGHTGSRHQERRENTEAPQEAGKMPDTGEDLFPQEPEGRQEESGAGRAAETGNQAAHMRPAERSRLRPGNGSGGTKIRNHEKSRKFMREKEEAAPGKESGKAERHSAGSHARLQFEHGEKPDGKDATHAGRRAAAKKARAAKSAAAKENGRQRAQGQNVAGRTRLRFEETDGERGADSVRLNYSRNEKAPDGRAAAADGGMAGNPESAAYRAEKAGRKLEKAQEKLPAHRKARLEKQQDSASGKVKRRLRFGKEAAPEGEGPSAAKRAGRALGAAAYMAAATETGRKMQEAGQDNAAVDAASRTANAAGGALRLERSRRAAKSWRAARRAKRDAPKAKAGLQSRKTAAENPERKKRTFAKWAQKKRIQRSYAAAARESANGVKRTGDVLDAAGRAVRSAVKAAAPQKGAFAVLAIGILAAMLFGSLFSSCSAMLTGIQSAILSTCYTADSADMDAAELRYTEMEADLQIDIAGTESSHPGYDEYRYSIAEIGHNPFELMGCLSAAYGNFTYARAEAEVERLFGLQYSLIREEITETRTYTDEDGEEQEYGWTVLKTTLAVTPLSEIIAGALSGEAADVYGVLMQTCGNRQCFGNPLGTAWIPYVTSPYGYRVGSGGAKEIHYGVDIGAAYGAAVYSMQDGRVVSAGNAGDMGLCVVIEDGEGYRSVYARCASVSVSAGQEVKRGDAVAAVGNSGAGTGTYLHLEVKYGSEHLNPYFFVENGGSGYAPGGGAAGAPDMPEDPGGEMGDGSFAAMLAEAEKYIGYPYVWGGSSPSTSFDCSGYVSWVINQSGVGSVGRQTAQGLYNLCTPVSKADLKPGDLVFFTGTYSTANPVTHVGIYVGNGRMIHCGNPIGYADISTPYWTAHFYSGGRLP